MKIGNLKQIQQGNCFETFHNLNTTEQQCSNKKKKDDTYERTGNSDVQD